MFPIRTISTATYLTKRYNFTGPFGSAPSQLPLPGEPGWKELMENVERNIRQPPLTPYELKRGQDLFEMKKRFDHIEKMYWKTIRSNQRLSREIRSLIRRLDK